MHEVYWLIDWFCFFFFYHFLFCWFFPFILSFPHMFLFPELAYGDMSQENKCIIDRKMTVFKKIIGCIFFLNYICSKGILKCNKLKYLWWNIKFLTINNFRVHFSFATDLLTSHYWDLIINFNCYIYSIWAKNIFAFIPHCIF